MPPLGALGRMDSVRHLLIIIAIACFFVAPLVQAGSEATPPRATTLPTAGLTANAGNDPEAKSLTSLADILRRVVANNAQLHEAMGDIAVAQAQVERARAAIYPQANGLFLVAPMITIQGNALNATYDWTKLGPYTLSQLTVIQPLYTFGQIDSYRKAADAQVVAREFQAAMKKNEVVNLAKEIYYGYRMACDLGQLVNDSVSFLEEASQTADQNLKSKKKKQSSSGAVTPHDLYHLKTVLEDLRQKRLQAESAQKTAARALEWVAGAPIGNLDQDPTEVEDYQPKGLDAYLQLAHEHRPEFRALEAGKKARLALAEAKKAQDYPAVFVGGTGQFTWTPTATRQESYFAWDPFNRWIGGFGLGLKFDFEFARHHAEAQEERAEYLKLEATQANADNGIELSVKKAYWEWEQASQGLEIALTRKKVSRKWFVSNAMGWSIGITAAKDLMESLEGQGLGIKNYVETVYAVNVALGHLSLAVGKEITSLDYGL